MKHRSKSGDRYTGHARLKGRDYEVTRLRGLWHAVARGPDGQIKWEESWENIVTDQGLDHALDVTLSNGTQSTTWYVAITKTLGGSPATTSTYQNFMGVANQEVTAYDEAARTTWSDGGVSGQSVDNSSVPARFTISSDSTVVGGAALVNDNTKGDNGAGPIMYAAGAFTAGDKTLDDDDTLDVTATFTSASS